MDASGSGVGTRVGDRLIEEANQDPDFKFNKGDDSLKDIMLQDQKNEKKTTWKTIVEKPHINSKIV